MRKKYWILMLLCLPSILWGAYLIGSWQNVGNVMQRSQDGFNYRISLGSNAPGYFYTYQKSQIDSLFLNIPSVSISDSSHKPLNTATFHQYIAAKQVYFSPFYFAHTGAYGDDITVINSDSLNHHAPAYYLAYSNFTGVPTSLPPNGTAGGDLSGTYPNPSVVKFNAQLPSYYLNYANFTGKPTDLSSFTNGPGYALIDGTNTDRTAANFGQTASEPDVAHWPTAGGGSNTYEISGWLHIASGSGYAITMQMTFVYGGTTFTMYFFPKPAGTTTLPTSAVLSAVNFYTFEPMNIRVDASTTIQVSTTLASGTILYEDGATINLRK